MKNSLWRCAQHPSLRIRFPIGVINYFLLSRSGKKTTAAFDSATQRACLYEYSVLLRTCSGLGMSNELMMKEWQKRFMMGKGRSRLIFENTVSKVLEEDYEKCMRTPRRPSMKRLMSMDEAKEVCRERDRSVYHSVPSERATC